MWKLLPILLFLPYVNTLLPPSPPNDALLKGKVSRRNLTIDIKEFWDKSSRKELQLWDSFFQVKHQHTFHKAEEMSWLTESRVVITRGQLLIWFSATQFLSSRIIIIRLAFQRDNQWQLLHFSEAISDKLKWCSNERVDEEGKSCWVQGKNCRLWWLLALGPGNAHAQALSQTAESSEGK